MRNYLYLLLLFAGFVFGIEQDPAKAYATPAQANINYTVPRFTSYFKVTGNVGVDTVITSIALPKFAIVSRVWVVVADTVESRGDSALVKVLVGSTEVFSQMTSAFKLGVSTAPRAFPFTASAYYTPIPTNYNTGNVISYRITQTAAGASTGITEGTFYVMLEYILPFRTNTLP